MATAKKHQMTKEELRAPDEVEVALKGFWEKIYKFRKVLLGGVAALLAIGIVIWVVGAMRRSAADADALTLYQATRAVGADVGPEETLDTRLAKLPRPPRFADEGTRLEAANEQVSKYLADNGGDAGAKLAALTLANVKLNKGDAAGALTDVEKWLGDNADSPAVLFATELKARAQVAAGEREKAIATLEGLAKAASGLLKAELLIRIGDLHNPVLNNGQGDAAQARTAYLEAQKALPPVVEEEDKLSSLTGKPGLRGQLENKLGLVP